VLGFRVLSTSAPGFCKVSEAVSMVIGVFINVELKMLAAIDSLFALLEPQAEMINKKAIPKNPELIKFSFF
jgi:hypothetical protein